MVWHPIRDWHELTRVRLELARLRRSQYARDLFAQGYRTGYQKGRVAEREGAFNIIGPDPDPPHTQVQVYGIEVDDGMRDLLVALWHLGLDTQFSCQGHPEKYSPHQSYSHDYAAQIVFGNIDDAVRFMKTTAELLGHKNYSEGGVVLKTMAPIDSETPRADVTFSPVLLGEVTEGWIALEKSARFPSTR